MSFDPIRGIALVEKLAGEGNWRTWKSDIKALLKADGTWDWVSDPSNLPSDSKALDAAKAKLKVAAYCIEMTCDATNRGIIDGKDDASDMFKALKAHYEGDTPAKRMELRRSLYRLEHEPSVPVIQFINNIRTIINSLAAIGHEPKPDEIRDIVLMNLNPSFEVIRTILASQDKNGDEEWTLDALSSQLTAFEANRIARGDLGTTTTELVARVYSQSNRQRIHRSRSSDNWGNIKGISGACDRCGHTGHIAAMCFRDMPEHAKDRIRRQKESANAVTSSAHHVPSGPLSLSRLRSTLTSGNTVTFYSDSGIITRGDDLVGKIHYSSQGFDVEEHYIKASYADADDGLTFWT